MIESSGDETMIDEAPWMGEKALTHVGVDRDAPRDEQVAHLRRAIDDGRLARQAVAALIAGPGPNSRTECSPLPPLRERT